MQRRVLVFGSVALLLRRAAAAAAPPRAGKGPAPKVAFLCATPCSSLPNPALAHDQAFQKTLEEYGFTLGDNLALDMVGVSVGMDRLGDVARRLVDRNAAVIVVPEVLAAEMALRATQSIPIVMMGVADPVEAGLVRSLGRPGGNVTGVGVPLSNLIAKQVGLLKEIEPRLSRVAVLFDPSARQHGRLERIETQVRQLGVRIERIEAAAGARSFDQTFSRIRDSKADGVVALEHLSATLAIGELALFALREKLPSVAQHTRFVQAGGLFAYGPSAMQVYAQAAKFVARVLGGVKPADLPVEEPTRYDLAVNGGTAKALGLMLPPSLLMRADQVIE